MNASADERGTPLQRILVKFSGEALGGAAGSGIDPAVIDRVAADIVQLARQGMQLALVVGGGNLFRGAELARVGLDRVLADQMGMLATVMNGLAMLDAIRRGGGDAVLYSAFGIDGMVSPYSAWSTRAELDRGRVAILAGGTGNPFFTTDSAACLRAVEIRAELVLKATKVDGVYTADPALHADAELLAHTSYDAVLAGRLAVMDETAICLCRDHGMPIRVFNMNRVGALADIAAGAQIGTLVDANGPGGG